MLEKEFAQALTLTSIIEAWDFVSNRVIPSVHLRRIAGLCVS